MSFAESISVQADFSPKGITPSGLQTRTHKLISNAGSQSIAPNSTLEFSIPTGGDALLDTNSVSLEFSLLIKETTNAVKTARMDMSAYPLFQSYTLLHNSVPLETCTQYPLLANMLLDLSMSFADRACIQGARLGCMSSMDLASIGNFAVAGTANPQVFPRGLGKTVSTALNAAGDTGTYAFDMSAIRWGTTVINTATAAATPAALTKVAEFSIPVISGVIGSLATKALPLMSLTGDLRVRFQTNLLERGLQITVTDNATEPASGNYDWAIGDVRLMYKTIHLGGLAEQMRMAFPMPTLASTFYGHNSVSVQAGDVQVQKTLSFRYSSLNDVFGFHSPSEKSGKTFNPEYSRRTRNNLTQFAISVGGKYYPSQKLDCTNKGEVLGYLAEACHVKNKMSWANSIVTSSVIFSAANTVIGGVTYQLPEFGDPYFALSGDSADATGLQVGTAGWVMNSPFPESFVLAVPTQSFQHTDSHLLSGVDTLDASVMAEMSYTGGATEQCVFHFFAHHDQILSVDAVGQCSMRY